MSKKNEPRPLEIWGQDATYVVTYNFRSNRYDDILLKGFATKLREIGLSGAKLITSLICEFSPRIKGKMYTTFWEFGNQVISIGCQYDQTGIAINSEVIVIPNPGKGKLITVLWDYVFQRNYFRGFFQTTSNS